MIREIPKTFDGRGEVKGFTFTQIAANEHGYIYEVFSGTVKHYEVFRRRIRDTFDMIDGVRVVTGQKYSYPSSNAFGIWAWTKFKVADAIYRLDQLEKKESV